jgi:naphthalene 1,2-dioxygenase ferredoxin component
MSEPMWVDVLGVKDLPTDDVVAANVMGREIAIYTFGSEVYATDNFCTHGNARLCDGFLEGHQIECPLHQGKFDVRNGAPLCEPVTEALRSYPIKLENSRVFVQILGPKEE